ncbi:DNA polymerase alpha catalytic subunit-like [Paramuricea clavata]|uniref:DNA polymerase alpha catalytic subunit-like n=1 Tax=Paramuricea clavata TaxID=317549 RepID=A0A7D9EZU0_PARCT|nr:DNA polymerase alpha catalytic subunit-like [Paramuricea clavata]
MALTVNKSLGTHQSAYDTLNQCIQLITFDCIELFGSDLHGSSHHNKLSFECLEIPNQPMSWCKLEAIVGKPDHITPLTEGNLDPPPLVVLSVSVRTMLNPKTHLHEVLAVTGLVHQDFRVDKVAPKDKYFQHYFCGLFS